MSEIVPVEELKRPKFFLLLHYPLADPAEAAARVKEIAGLGVTHIVLDGPVSIGPLRVLGKGCVSIVVKALSEWGPAALKIRRADSNRPSMKNEAKLQGVANSVGVGPTLYAHSNNAIVMELVEGVRLKEWVASGFSSEALRSVVASSLLKARMLDVVGLDHGELSRAGKHIIVTRGHQGRIIDFESASLTRRPRNVTSLASYFFMRKPLAQLTRELVRDFNVEKFLSHLRTYKQVMDDEAFGKLMDYLHLPREGL